MKNDLPIGAYELRTRIARKAWSIFSEGEDDREPPLVFYRIADMAIVEVHKNVDKMITQTIKDRLEALLDN